MQNPESGAHRAALQSAHEGARVLAEDTEQMLWLGLEAVRRASLATGRLTMTGRLRQTGPGGDFRFEPANNNALTVDMFDEERQPLTLVFTFERTEGQGSNADEFLRNDHDIAVRVEVAHALNLHLVSRRVGTHVSANVTGSRTLNDVPLDVALTYQGTRTFEVDSTGSSATTILRSTGRITGPGFEVDVAEDFEAQLVSSSLGSANASTSRVGNVVRADGQTYTFDSVLVRRNFRDGVPNDVDRSWRAEGRILRDGVAMGQYRLDAEVIDRQRGRGFVVVSVDFPEGSLELERWQQLQ